MLPAQCPKLVPSTTLSVNSIWLSLAGLSKRPLMSVPGDHICSYSVSAVNFEPCVTVATKALSDLCECFVFWSHSDVCQLPKIIGEVSRHLFRQSNLIYGDEFDPITLDIYKYCGKT